MKIKNENLNASNSERFVNYMWYSPKQWREWKARGRKDKEALTNKQKYDIGDNNEKLQSKIIRSRRVRRTYNSIQHRANGRTD